MGWTGIPNGELLRLAGGSFDAFVTADQNLEHQQNLDTLPLAVVVLTAPTNQIQSLRPLIPALLRAFETLAPRQLVRVGVGARSAFVPGATYGLCMSWWRTTSRRTR